MLAASEYMIKWWKVIVGKSGSGKSSLLDLFLSKFYGADVDIKIGVTETTEERTRYLYESNSDILIVLLRFSFLSEIL